MNYPQKLTIGGVAVVISQWKDGRVAVVYTAPGDNKRTVKPFGSGALADAHVATLEKQFQAVPTLRLVGQQKLIVERALAAAKRCDLALDRLVESYETLLGLLYQSGGGTPMQAIEFYCKARPEALKEITLEMLVEEFLDASKWRCRPRTLVPYP